MDAAGTGSPFSLALMHSVKQGAKDEGVSLSREQLLWVLQRAKGNESLAISLAVSQKSSRRALKALRDPTELRAFDVGGVTAPMVRKVKETLKADALRHLLDELDSIDEEAGEAVAKPKKSRPEEVSRVGPACRASHVSWTGVGV